MARISFDTLQETVSTNSGDNNNGIKLFALKNDGDVAIVRIMHDSVADFDILTTHKIKVGDKWRSISCIRDPREPIDNCPLCKNNEKIQQRFYIHMIQYTQEPNGQIVATPVVWDRTAGEYANKFKTLIEEYGPLSDLIFKIKRNGKAGDMGTTYEILMGNQSIYPAESYPKINAFDSYSALGRIVLDKNYNEINSFLATGTFPQNNNNTNANQVADGNMNNNVAPNYTPPVNQGTYTGNAPMNTVPTNNTGAPTSMPWDNNSAAPTMNRPVRRY